MMHVLVTVASRHGSTREIADAIAQELRMPGIDADVRHVEEVPDLNSYDAVVLGSAIYMGNWESAANQSYNDISPGRRPCPCGCSVAARWAMTTARDRVILPKLSRLRGSRMHAAIKCSPANWIATI